MGNIFTMEGIWCLFDYTLNGLKMEQLNERIINDAIDVMSIINTI